MTKNTEDIGINQGQISPMKAVVDLVLFLAVMFFIRTIYFEGLGFFGNAMVNSIATLAVATLLLYLRGQSWKNMGLTRPGHLLKMLGITVGVVLVTIFSIMVFEIFIRDLLPASINPPSQVNTDSRFRDIKGNVNYFFSVIVIVWIESFFEELQDRGFSLNRFESLFSKIPWSVVLAVLAQAAIFGFRHSPTHGIPGAITTGIIGLIFGIAYILFGRNLWPLIIAHCCLNTMSMVERF